MLNVLRENFKAKPYLRIVLGIVAVAMVLSLGYYFSTSGGSGLRNDWIVRVNGSEIPAWRFREVASNLDEYYRNLFGDNYDQIKPQLQIRRQAMEALVEKELVLQDARRMGLETSATDLANRVRTHPSLQDESGQFIGKERYKQALERNYPGGYTAFERLIAEDAIDSMWTSLITQAVDVPDGELKDIFRQRTEKTSIDYVLVPSSEQEIDREVGDGDLRGWYDAHLDDYMREAGRNIRYVVIDRDAQMDRIEIADGDIQAYYDSNQQTYTHPEQRRARHMLFRLDPGASEDEKQAIRARAEAALERVRAGEVFAALAEELSEDVITAANGGDLDFFGRGQMVEAFEGAAFDTPVGQLAPVTESTFGFHVIEVTDSRDAGVSPISEVEDDIRKLLRFREVDDRIAAEAQRLSEALESADRFDDVATGEGLTVENAFFNERERIPGLGPSPEFTSTVLGLEPGEMTPPLRVAAGMAIAVVDEVKPAEPSPFEEVRDAVKTELVDSRARDAALAAARSALDRTEDLRAAGRALEQEVQSSGELAPGQALPGIGGSTSDFEDALFGDAVTVGTRDVLGVPTGAIVYEVTERAPFDAARFETEKSNLLTEALQERRARFRQTIVNRMKQSQQIEYNPVWLESLDG